MAVACFCKVGGMKWLLPLLFPCIAAAQFDGGGGNTALVALAAVPPDYADAVVKLSADNAHPDPGTWYAMAFKGGLGGSLHSIAVSGGEVVQNEPSLNIGTLVRNHTAIDTARVAIDSPQVYALAQTYCAANNAVMTSASFVLTQAGKGAVPLWEIWCYDAGENQLGYLKLSAVDATVLSTEGFANTP